MNVPGERIDVAAIREELGLTQSELADLLGVSPRMIQSCEQAWRQPSAALEKTLLLHLIISRRGAALAETSCWEHVGCSEEARRECPVYRSRQGHLCWMLSGNMCCARRARVEDWEAKKRLCSGCAFFETLMADAGPSATDTFEQG
ncbi:MAG: helix-turn-helix domain-containing protein [Armatimonadota bacterium]|jgi:DNA-binding XRE family transcriptional regulator